MTHIEWKKPVACAHPRMGYVEVHGPFEALALLTDGWPIMSGRHFIQARTSCRAALADHVPAEQARQAFEKAVGEATQVVH
jgi:hypothetical protein